MHKENDGGMGSSPTRGYGVLESFLARQRCRVANKLIPERLKDGRVLDIGCSAHPLFLLNTAFSEKYGLDKMIGEAHVGKYSAQNIVLTQGDFEAQRGLPFEDKMFEAVTMLAVFEHIEPEDLVRLMSEIRRVLKPGGIFVMTTPAFWTDLILKVMSFLRLVSPDEIDEHKDAYDFRTIEQILVEGGFDKADIKLGTFELGMNIWATAFKGQAAGQ